MLEHKQTILLAPALSNSSCWRSGPITSWSGPGPGELIRAVLILALSLGILCANLLVICVINSRRYSKYIHAQPRYLLTSLASNDLAIGLLVTPFGFLPAVYGCWPYGEVACQIQALLRGALTQQSAVILVCMAIDRYMCMLHPHHYHRHSSKKYYMRQGCVAVMSTTWIASVAVFGALVLPRGGYYFNGSGLLACDPFFARASLRILACCCFYFPTTMVLMYCYGSAFHVNKLRLKRVVCVNAPEVVSGGHIERLVAHERRLSTSASRTMAAMSLGFIVMVTPWTIQEVVAACTGSKPPPFLDFLATWLALSNSFWNPFLYWLLNNHFRRISKELLYTKILCRPKPLGPKQHCCATSTGGLDICSIGGLDLSEHEITWGILIRYTIKFPHTTRGFVDATYERHRRWVRDYKETANRVRGGSVNQSQVELLASHPAPQNRQNCIERCSMERCSMARCSSLSLATTPPPWETGPTCGGIGVGIAGGRESPT